MIATPEPRVPVCQMLDSDEILIPPPLPPPRIPNRSIPGHARSSSLDLNKLQMNNRRSTWSSNGFGDFQCPLSRPRGAPSIPIAMSPHNLNGELVLCSEMFSNPICDLVGANDDHHGAFSVYKKVKSPLPPRKSCVEPEGDHSRTLKVIQSQFSLEPIPCLIPK